ncbi:nicotinamide riboside transporter PnuC [Geminocystis sp. GBBB08]|uniref:nicotinamide riboside transporter PnuC n=1 Tax=Geminocystis sp. GBBB08 TaxID=2604140 RepID=UPI0027E234E8|nr:nicotinamide riboside transporter PnuC [Geminocystis sp. GBBB08]
MFKKNTISNFIGISLSVVLLILSWQTKLPLSLTPLESIALIFSAWSVWLLSQNQLLGWWLGLIGVIAYGIVFYRVQLYGEVGLQVFYLITSIQGIWIWWRGGKDQTEKPITNIKFSWLIISFVASLLGIIALRLILIKLNGSAPFWDAFTTVYSIIAQLYLMLRYVQSWYLWIIVDIVYIPLYLSRGLYFTSFLYAIFLIMAVRGLIQFKKLEQEQYN